MTRDEDQEINEIADLVEELPPDKRGFWVRYYRTHPRIPKDANKNGGEEQR